MSARPRPEPLLGGCLLLVAAALLLYAPSLHAPFYFDDQVALVDNYLLRDLGASFSRLFTARGLTNLSFALNYRLSGLALLPLHLTNIAIHAASGCLVFLLLRRWFAQRWLPLLGALLFIAHPLQTQAVTYLVQRAASLATGLALLALWLHLRHRDALAAGEERGSRAVLLPWGGAVLAFGLALLAKENVALLPLLLFIHDRLLPPVIARSHRQAFLDYLPYAVVLAILGSLEVRAALAAPALHAPLASLQGNDPLHYLFTEFSVLWIYLRLWFLPWGQALEHNYPIVERLLTGQNLLALAGLLALGALAWRRRRQRPLFSFGVAWFFCGLAVESSLIPLDPLFEHRLYLPAFGLILSLLDLLTTRLPLKAAQALLLTAIGLCSLLTWQRNQLWSDPLAFYEANQRRVPQSERVCQILADLYQQAGRSAEVRRQYQRLELLLPPGPSPFHQRLILYYAAVGEDEHALALVEAGLRLRPQDPETYKSGALYWTQRRQPQRAMEFLQRGLNASPETGKLYDLIGALALDQNDLPRAEAAFRQARQHGVQGAASQRNLAEVLYRQGRLTEALTLLQGALQRTPGRPDLYEGVGRVAVALGDRQLAEWAAQRLRRIDPASWQRLQEIMQDGRG